MIFTFYGRVSTDSDMQLSAMENQESYWREYFDRNGMKMNTNCGVFYKRNGESRPTGGYYIDEGISGYKSKRFRKAFLQMIEDGKQKKFDMIYTRSISRFGRNVKEVLDVIDILRESNVGVFFEDVKINTLDSNSDLMLTIFAGMAQEESRSKSHSVQKGKYTAAKKNIWAGREPYGYDIVQGKLTINEDEAKVVKMIFDLYLNNGWGLSKIAKHLNKLEIPRKRNAKKWDQSILGKMLSNPIYDGKVWLHRTYIKDPKLGIIEKVPEEQQIKYDDENLRIIDHEKFINVQEEKKRRFTTFGDFKYVTKEVRDEITGKTKLNKIRVGIDRTNSRYSGAHLFSNLLRCGNCGGTLRYKKQTSSSGRVHNYWICSNNERLGNCEFRNLQRQEVLLEWVKSEIVQYRADKKRHEENFKYFANLKFDREEAKQKVEELNHQLEELTIEREANFKLYSREKITEDEYVERNNRITKEIDNCKNEIDKLTNIDREIEFARNKFDEHIDTLAQVDVENLDNVTLRKIIRNIEVFTHDDGEKYRNIHWNFIEGTEVELWDNFTNKQLIKLGLI